MGVGLHKEKQPQEESQTVNKDQTPTEKNPTTEQTPTPETKSPEEIPKGNENVDNPTAKESLAQQCLNLICNTKNKKSVNKDKTKHAGESYAQFFYFEDGFKLEEDGSYNIALASIFPSLNRDEIDTEQTSILDQILEQMKCTWSKKFKTEMTINNKKKRPRTADSPKASPPHKNVKAEEKSQ